jgi:hypothetical protein
MNPDVDHIVWACRDLSAGIDEIEAMTGVRAQAGGKHSKLGTHNALIHIGNRSYLEIVAPDPDQPGGPWSRSLQNLAGPGVLHWVIARSHLEAYAKGLDGLIGGANEVIRVSRQHPTLGLLEWKLLMLPKHDFGCLVPFLIDWGDSTHPTETLERRCTLNRIRITSPELAELMKVGAWLGTDASYSDGHEPKLKFLIDTPNGRVTLATPRPLPLGVSFD